VFTENAEKDNLLVMEIVIKDGLEIIVKSHLKLKSLRM